MTLKENETRYLTTPNLSVSRNVSVDCYFEIHASSPKSRLPLNVPDSVLEAAPFWNCDDHLSVSEGLFGFNDVLHLHYHSNDNQSDSGVQHFVH